MHKHRSRSAGHSETPGSPVDGTKKMFPLIGPETKEIQIAVKCVRMSEEMINSAAKMAEDALRQNTTRKDVAAYVKKGFDEKYGPLWHCIVGKDFGSYVTHQDQGFIVFRVDDWAFLLFSTRQ
nr:dynein light chain [Hymenolepis microstoma]